MYCSSDNDNTMQKKISHTWMHRTNQWCVLCGGVLLAAIFFFFDFVWVLMFLPFHNFSAIHFSIKKRALIFLWNSALGIAHANKQNLCHTSATPVPLVHIQISSDTNIAARVCVCVWCANEYKCKAHHHYHHHHIIHIMLNFSLAWTHNEPANRQTDRYIIVFFLSSK